MLKNILVSISKVITYNTLTFRHPLTWPDSLQRIPISVLSPFTPPSLPDSIQPHVNGALVDDYSVSFVRPKREGFRLENVHPKPAVVTPKFAQSPESERGDLDSQARAFFLPSGTPYVVHRAQVDMVESLQARRGVGAGRINSQDGEDVADDAGTNSWGA